MSKKTLNLSIEEEIKRRAKRIARKRGISVSRFFEDLVAREEDPEDYSPEPGTAAYKIYNLIPESKKVAHYDYKKRKEKALKEKYNL